MAIDKVFTGGQIFIQLQDNMISFVAGSVVSGIVHVNLQQPCFDCDNLTVGLYGSEEVYFRKAHRQGKRTVHRDHFGHFPIISLVFPIAQFVDGPPRPGQMSYPFTLQIPDWLPASMMLGGDHEKARLSIQYSLRAQFTPKNLADWAVPQQAISSFKGTTMIYVYRPALQTPQVDLQFSLRSEVGGFIGMGTTVCNSQIFFEKNQYYLGETAKVKIVCNNSECHKDIKSFKFKLLRVYQGNEMPGHFFTSNARYLVAQKEQGLARGEKAEREYSITIPTADQFNPEHAMHMHPDLHPMLSSFSISVQGKIIRVDYILKVFVKHESWNEFGEGKAVALPIKILQPPMQIVSQTQVTAPQDWQPQIAQAVHLAMPAQPQDAAGSTAQLSQYQSDVLIPQQHQWQMNQEPRVENVGADGLGKTNQAPDPNMVEGQPVEENNMGAAQAAAMQQQQPMPAQPQQMMMNYQQQPPQQPYQQQY